MGKWSDRFLGLADHISEWSYDPSRKVGAVIVDEKHRVISMGYNGFPRGVSDTAERYENRETKMLFVCHAERNALDNSPLSVDGQTMYSTLFPCSECAKSIIQSGIRKVVSYNPGPIGEDPFNWTTTVKMFKEAGIETFFVDR